MGKFYILSLYYEQNSAPTNHALSFIQGFSDLGIKAEWIFLMPYGDLAKLNKSFHGITIRYLWKEKLARNRIIKHLYMYYSFTKFFFSLKKGDTVLLLGMSSFLDALTKRKGIKVFHERTEHPDAVRTSRYQFVCKRYLPACKRADGIFLISNALKTYYCNQGVEASKVHVINMVVDSNRFVNIKKEELKEHYIAYCGKASNSKDGVDDLIKAFALVVKAHPEYKLYVIGEAPTKESDNHQLVKELDIENHIIFTGVVPADKIPQLLINADILALARPNNLQTKYGFPTKLGEYLLTGNPVVITNVGDIPLFLEDGNSALISDCKDIRGFADKIIWAIEHPVEAKIIGIQGKKVAEDNFNYLNETRKMASVMFEKEDI